MKTCKQWRREYKVWNRKIFNQNLINYWQINILFYNEYVFIFYLKRRKKMRTKEEILELYLNAIKFNIKISIIIIPFSILILYLAFLIERNFDLGSILDSILGIIGILCYISIFNFSIELVKNLWDLIRFPKMKKALKQFVWTKKSLHNEGFLLSLFSSTKLFFYSFKSFFSKFFFQNKI